MNPIEKITLRFNDSASTICPLRNNIVARVTPHPGHGRWNNNLLGQTTTFICPSVKNEKNSHMHTPMYAHMAQK